jgi:hypothetical protein
MPQASPKVQSKSWLYTRGAGDKIPVAIPIHHIAAGIVDPVEEGKDELRWPVHQTR